MKPSFLNLFMKKLTRDLVVPIISARVSWLTLAITGSGLPSLGDVRERLTFRLRKSQDGRTRLRAAAIVFWTHHPGEITRFDRLEDAVHSIMLTPSTKLFSIAWIRREIVTSR
jgi:hypothetical protein